MDGLTYHYEWQVDGVDGVGKSDVNFVQSNTASTYIPTVAEDGGSLTVIITVTRPGYTTSSPMTVHFASPIVT